MLHHLQLAMRLRLASLAQRFSTDPERGDIAAWVLVVVMTVGLVLLVWAIAGPALDRIITNALNQF